MTYIVLLVPSSQRFLRLLEVTENSVRDEQLLSVMLWRDFK